MVDSRVIAFLILMLAAAPLLFIALGLGWACRGMATGLHKLTFGIRTTPIPPLRKV